MVAAERLDGKDLRILSTLIKNARSSLREIGREVSLSPSSVKNRISRLIEMGVIERFTVDVDYKKMGYELQVLVMLTIKPGRSEAVYEILSHYDNINRIYMTAGPASIVCILRVRNIEELSQFLKKQIEQLDGIEKIETMFIIPPKAT